MFKKLKEEREAASHHTLSAKKRKMIRNIKPLFTFRELHGRSAQTPEKKNPLS
jgi:hypothetical protein